VCCSVLQCVAVRCSEMNDAGWEQRVTGEKSMLQYVAVCCSMLQYVAVCFSEMITCEVGAESDREQEYISVRCSVLQCGVVK